MGDRTVKLNLEIDIVESARYNWTPLQTDICMRVALAKREAFICESERMADLVRLKMLPKTIAADCLHEAAAYNSLYFEYGADHIQKIMSAALGIETAA
jgi:hypothetical protein